MPKDVFGIFFFFLIFFTTNLRDMIRFNSFFTSDIRDTKGHFTRDLFTLHLYLDWVFKRCRANKKKMNPLKCTFGSLSWYIFGIHRPYAGKILKLVK